MLKDLKKIHWYEMYKFQNHAVKSLMLATDC